MALPLCVDEKVTLARFIANVLRADFTHVGVRDAVQGRIGQ